MTSTCAYEVVDDLRQIVPEIIRGSVSWMYSSCDVPAKIDDTARRIHDTCEAITASVVSNPIGSTRPASRRRVINACSSMMICSTTDSAWVPTTNRGMNRMRPLRASFLQAHRVTTSRPAH